MIAIVSVIALVLMLMFFYQTGKMNEQYDIDTETLLSEPIEVSFEVLDV